MISQGIPRLTVRQLNRLLTGGLITSEQVCSYCFSLAVAGQDVWKLHAFSNLLPKEDVLDRARDSDDRRRHGEALSVLDGIPVSIKGNLAVADQPLTAGSRILGEGRSDTPAVGYDADVVRSLLIDNGAVLVGITTMDEFGMGSLGTNVVARQHAGDDSTNASATPTRNPRPYLHKLGQPATLDDESIAKIIMTPMDAVLEAHASVCSDDDPIFSAGGSSSGSAASVAHGSSILSLGSDTGGSVRLPSAWCGVTGVKPTYGLLSRHGLVSYASSLDTVGLLAPSADCAALALDRLVRSPSDRDSTMSRLPPPTIDTNAETAGEMQLKGVKVGIPAAFSVEECPATLREAWAQAARDLERQGATVKVISTDQLSPELLQKSLAAYYVLVSAEASSNLARYDGFRYGVSASAPTATDIADQQTNDQGWGVLERQYAATRSQGLGKEVVRRVLSGTSVLSSDRFHTYYEAAAKLRAVLTRHLHATFEDVDLLLVPTTVFPPPQVGSEAMDATEMFANDVMTVPISLAGLPSVSVTVGRTDADASQPFDHALQLVGARHGEGTILKAARVLENAVKE